MTTQNVEVPPEPEQANDSLRHARLMVRMAESLKVQSEQLLHLTTIVVKLQRKSDGFGLPNVVRDSLLGFLTAYVVTDIVRAVIS
jgi:hypothetical protein